MAKKAKSPEELRVVLLGKTGSGKSSLGNTLLGREAFLVKDGFSSGTDRCNWADTDIYEGKILQVTDTPGVSDTHRDEEDILQEIGKCVAVSSPGPHVILMVLRCDKRFTKEESAAYKTLKNMFGDGICRHMIIVFNGADAYGATIEEQQRQLPAALTNCPPELNEVLKDANKRYIGVNNKAPKGERDRYAAILMKMIEERVKSNRGKYFQSKLSDEINKLVQPILKEKLSGDVTHADATRLANQAIVNEEVKPEFLKKLKAIVKAGLELALKFAVTAAVALAVSSCSVM